jgi:hypothetical protein
MRHGSCCRSYRFCRRGTSRPLRCESLEERRLLTITVDTLVDEADGHIDDGDNGADRPVTISGLTLTGGDAH